MSKRTLLTTSVAALVLIAGCMTAKKNSKPDAHWINNMHRLSGDHLYLMPKVADGRKFADPVNREGIQTHLQDLAEAASDLTKDPKAPNADPLIEFTAVTFAADARDAYSSFRMGDQQMARFTINRVSRYCISCHTRADRGIKDFDMSWTSELSGLSPAQRIDFLLANRRYQSALQETKKFARDSEMARRDPRTWLLTIERTMAMLVRVNDDPEQAEQLATMAYSNKMAPNGVRRETLSWIKDIREWRVQRKARVRDRLSQATNLLQVRPSFIRNLRASAILHEMLEDSQSAEYAEALYYSGIAANALRDLNMAALDQYYYETCINRVPHSELAERCFSRLEASVRASNPILELDPDLAMAASARLADLRRLAETKESITDPKWMQKHERNTGPEKGP